MKRSEIVVRACPVVDGQAPCLRCGGGWPGTLATQEQLSQAAREGNLNPEKLGCGTLANWALAALNDIEETSN